jgi:hypothetical protein
VQSITEEANPQLQSHTQPFLERFKRSKQSFAFFMIFIKDQYHSGKTGRI